MITSVDGGSMSTVLLGQLQEYVHNNARAHMEARMMKKAVDTTSIGPIVPENLEGEAYNTQWDPTQPYALTALKLAPSTPATQIEHKYAEITSYGGETGFGDVSERSLPAPTQPSFAQRTTNVRLSAAYSDVYLLPTLEQTLSVDGQVGPEAITRAALWKSVLWKKNRSIYFADTTTMRLGASGTRHRGWQQLIREGTDGTTGTASRFGSHIIDMEGAELTITTVREKVSNVMLNYGYPSTWIMAPAVRARFESTLDPANRLQMPVGRAGILPGQNVSGMTTNGGVCMFFSDIMLDPNNAFGKYRGAADDGAPGTPTAATGTAQAYSGSTSSKWRSTDAGTVYYWVTEIRDGRESAARAIGSVTVAANQEVLFALTPSDAYSDSFRIYRHTANTATSAWAIMDVANSGGGAAVAAYDRNESRPGTHTVFALDIASRMAEYAVRAATGSVQDYATPAEAQADFFRMPDSPQNAVSVAHLGPMYGSMVLGNFLMTKDRPLYYSAFAPQVRGPKKCLVFRNVAGIGQ